MPEENLTADERAAVLKVLRDTIAADRYPLSPRMRTLKSAVAKLDPASMQRVSAPATAEALDQQHDRSKEALALIGTGPQHPAFCMCDRGPTVVRNEQGLPSC